MDILLFAMTVYNNEDLTAILRLKKSWSYKLALLKDIGMPVKNLKRNRKVKGNRKRERGWALQQINEMPEGLFKKMFRLDRETFQSLLDLLDAHMEKKNEQKAINSSGSSISITTKLAMTLRWLAGGSYLDICFAFSVSVASFYSKDGCLWSTMAALDAVLPLSFPLNSPDDLNRIANEFGHYSGGAMQGCVGAIDGLLIRTRAPFSKEHSNPSSFKNRKCTFGILALGIADLKGKFLMFNVNHSGSTHDSLAWATSSLQAMIANGDLDKDLFLIGDEAFSCTNQVQSPWSGRGLGRWKDSYNYHLSSCRQCIERAFGMLIKRWGILQRKLIVDFERWSLVSVVCAKLHNICCDANIPAPSRWLDDVLPDDLPLVYLNNDYSDFDNNDIDETRAPNGLVNRRLSLTEWLEAKGCGRPIHNTQSRA